jgi:hydrogenase maturation protein HypF
MNTDTAEIALRFHQTMAAMLTTVCQQIAANTGLQTVALSGGCFQNRLLLALAGPKMTQAGFRLLVHHQVPCNDGGLSPGQAALAHFVHSRP